MRKAQWQVSFVPLTIWILGFLILGDWGPFSRVRLRDGAEIEDKLMSSWLALATSGLLCQSR